MSRSDDGSKKGRAKAIPPPPPGRDIGALQKRAANLPEAQIGVVAGVRRAGESSIPPPHRPDMPTLAPPSRKGEKSVRRKVDEVSSEELDIILGVLEGEVPPKISSNPPPSPGLSAICMFGRFEVLGRIAFGGMAEIFLGREQTQIGTSRFLAIKRILPHVADEEQFVGMFLDEARLAIQLNHPSICHIYEFGELESSYFIAMEWVNGVPLGKMIRKARADGGIPVEIAVKIISTIADALEYAHNAKDALGQRLEIVHRDVSPHNIMVAYDGHVKLLDFGIAKATSHASKTEAGTVKGKFSYMAPEQCLNKDLDGRVDIFALGICLWEALAGRPLYTRDNEFETMKAIIEGAPPSLSEERADVPAELDAIVRRALAKKREDRYQSAGEFQAALEGWLASSRQFVNASKIASVMDGFYSAEIRRGPLVDSTPFGESFKRLKRTMHTPASVSSVSSFENDVEPPSVSSLPLPEVLPTRRPAWLYGLPLLVLAMVGLATWQLWPSPETVVPDVAQTVDPAPDPAPNPEPDPEPNPEPAAVVALGTLSVTSTPSGGTVRVDDELLYGRTPMTLARMVVGTHHVAVAREGYEPWEGDVEVVADTVATLVAPLVRIHRDRPPEAPPGRLSINTRPWSKVYVGRRLIGTTPIAEARVTSGRLRLRLVDRDGNTHTKNVRVPANGTERVFFNLAE